MKLKSWNSLSSSLVLHAKVVSNRCMHVTLTIIISLRSCYNWQQLCGVVVRRLARQRKGDGGRGLIGWWVQRQQWESEEGERERGKGKGMGGGGGGMLQFGSSPSLHGVGWQSNPPPHLKTRVLHCVFTWINCPNYVCSTQNKQINKKQK